jgi:hypothetical protein
MWLKILASEADSVVLSWGNNDGPHPRTYRVGLATVRHETGQVRECLRALARWGVSSDPVTLGPILRELATAGYLLHYALFDGLSDADRSAAEEVRQWVNEQYEGDQNLCITTNAAIHIPWGLVCEQEQLTGTGGEVSIESFAPMWGLKYSLSATLSGYNYSKRKLERSGERRRVLSLLNQEVVDAIGVEEGARFREMIDRRPVGSARTLNELMKLIHGAGKGDTVLHFFGHQHEGQLILGTDNAIGVTRFKLLLDDLIRESGGASDSAGLIFLSACDGAYGDSDYSFVSAADRAGIMGLIATESAVPRNFAAKYVIRFMRLMEDGVSVGEAINQLRHNAELWPLSLLYGCYAQPGYRFVPTKGQA